MVCSASGTFNRFFFCVISAMEAGIQKLLKCSAGGTINKQIKPYYRKISI
jgi:hypothetical protein